MVKWLIMPYGTLSYGVFAVQHSLMARPFFKQWLGRPCRSPRFGTPGLYRHIRHPLYLGFFLALWATPTMSVAHLVFALLCSGYILAGTWFEERDLRRVHPEYDAYARAVPRYFPRLVD